MRILVLQGHMTCRGSYAIISFDVWHMAYDIWHMTYDVWHMTSLTHTHSSSPHLHTYTHTHIHTYTHTHLHTYTHTHIHTYTHTHLHTYRHSEGRGGFGRDRGVLRDQELAQEGQIRIPSSPTERIRYTHTIYTIHTPIYIHTYMYKKVKYEFQIVLQNGSGTHIYIYT
jgi:hypothetical protein